MIRTCLVCDDDSTVRKVTEFVLDKFTTLSVYLAESGEEAVELAKTCQLDFILMDIHMAGMNGIEAARRIKCIQPEALIFGYTADPDAIASMPKDVFTTSLHKVLKVDEVKTLVDGMMRIADVRRPT